MRTNELYWQDRNDRCWGLMRGRSLIGVLEQGPRKRPGWFVLPPYSSDPITRMNPNLTLAEAQDAARLLLLAGGQP